MEKSEDSYHFSSFQSLRHVRLFATPWIAACQASLSITNSRSSLKLTSIESVMPSSHLILCRPLLLPPIPRSIRDFSNGSTLYMRWPKYWSFNFSISPSTFTLAISCLTTSNLPWFMDITFQAPMQYCSLQHRTLLLSPVTSTAGYHFCFGSIPSFFLALFLHWSPVAYLAPTNVGSSSFSLLSFCLFILFMGFSRQEYWSGLPFPSPVDHILSDLSTMTRPSWVAPHGMV